MSASTLDKLFAIGRVLNKGECLKNPENWKVLQTTMNALCGIIAAIPIFTDVQITESQVNAMAYGFAIMLGLLNPYFTTATSDKVGLQIKGKSNK